MKKKDWYRVVLHSDSRPDVFAVGHNPAEEKPMTQEQFESFLKKFKDNVQLRKGEKAPDYDEIVRRFDKQLRKNISEWGRSPRAGMYLLEATRS